jgi:restriction system protein
MEVVLVLAAILAAVWWFGQSRKGGQDRGEARQQQAAERHVAHIDAIAKAAAQQHMRTLWGKWKQLTYVDDYGNFIDDSWRQEVRYFVETVIAPQLPFDPVTFESDKEQAAYTVGYEVLEYEMALDEASVDAPSDEYSAQMSGVEFELMVERILSSAGAKVTRTPVSGDQGVDLLAECRGLTIAIQCKRCATRIGNKAVQEVSAGRAYYSADRAWVVSDAPFTKSARQLAGSLDVELIQYLLVEEHLESATA